MNYFVTGLTGFIGNQLLENLIKRDGCIYALVRPGSITNITTLRQKHGLDESKLVAIQGDLSQPLCGVANDQIEKIKGSISAFYHLAAIYDLTADAESQKKANVEGTREAIKLAEAMAASGFHHVSSIAAAGFYPGTFKEEMFDEAVGVETNPYFLTKHLSEGLVRSDCKIPWRIYRPGAVIGNSDTGWINKADGPYFFFPILDQLAKALPRWVPLPIYKGNPVNIVPVDFVANAIDHISHKDGLDGKCFHLTDPKPLTLGEILNEFLRAAKGPTMSLAVPMERVMDFLPASIKEMVANKHVFNQVKAQLATNLNIPKEVLLTESMNTSYDCSNTLAALQDSDIEVPPLSWYASRIWHYWEHNLNPALLKPRTLEEAVKGKTVLITGGSDGIGKQLSVDCAEAGAKVIIVARTQEKLDAVVDEIRQLGGNALSYSCDLTDLDSIDELVDKVLEEHKYIDILVNNAGRSIRRSLRLTYDRFHDFERVMQINYFSAIRLSMGFLPSMTARKQGHIVNISTIAALPLGAPRFSAYVASKCALDAWSNTATLEYADQNVSCTNVHMPLVRTKMISATTAYNNVDVLDTKEASKLIHEAMINKPMEVNTMIGSLSRFAGIFTPKLAKLIFSMTYQLSDDSEAAKANAGKAEATPRTKFADKAMDALQGLELDDETFQSISKILKGLHN